MTGRRIAVIGSGVSGITAGYVLSHADYVTIFEADGRLGGHADTHLVTPPSGPPLGDRMNYAHPAYAPASVAAQRRLPELNAGVTAFAGAYHGWGFHEDGCRSGVQAARALGGTW